MTASINESLQWRYATKQFDPTKKVSPEDLNDLLESLRLTPSSFGIQAWKFVVVTNPDLRARLRENSWGQPQVTDASHLIVLCAHKTIDEKTIRHYVESIAEQRGVAIDTLKEYEDRMNGFVKALSPEALSSWLQKQLYIALGILHAACAAKKIDSCPMEGFDKAKVDEILELDKLNLQSVVLCPIGYRSSEDIFASMKKVRFALDELVVTKA
ncbi:MAG: NAD(P)H-dependent oxidoreductase [bacterium]